LVPHTAAADAVTVWNANAGKAAIAACLSPALDPLHESRAYAMTHIAIHDALNAIDRRFRPYAFNVKADPQTSTDAAVAAAARAVLVSVLAEAPSFGLPTCSQQMGIASVEADYAAALAAIPDGPAKSRGVLVGQAAASVILAVRSGDGSDTPLGDPNYPQGVEPGEYRFTSAFDFAFAPGWGNVRPFALKHGSQFRPGPPFNVRTRRYALDLNEVKYLGGDATTTPSARTADQTEIGLFWIESSPLAWNRLARAVTAGQGFDLWENARLFGLLNIAMADGYIGSWETKYHYNYWRPETAIRTADTDGNPHTEGDPTWTPLQPTYPMPDYDSAHSVEGGAAAQILKRVFGTDEISFTACSLSLPSGQTCTDPSPVTRSYASFSQAAAENAESRIFIGIHFRDAVEVGTGHGRRIADRAVNRFMRPVP
jgi:hypothetical protein